MVVASLAGTAILYLFGVIGTTERLAARNASDAVLCLFVGGMVIARALAPTGLFPWLGAKIVSLAKGKGWRLLVGIVLLIAPICMFLPNATVVILLAPVLIEAARKFKVDLVPLMLLAVFAANSAGLLSLVGDPATFIVASSVKMTFVQYLQRMTLGGLLSILTVLALLPVLFHDIWSKTIDPSCPEPITGSGAACNGGEAAPDIKRPVVLCLLLLIMSCMILFFVIGDQLPTPIPPQLSTLSFATLALLVVHFSKLDSVSAIIKDIDWETLIFFGSIFILVQALDSTGAIKLLGSTLAHCLSGGGLAAPLIMLFGIGVVSGFVPNIPLVAAMVPLVTSYAITSGLTTADAFAHGITALSPQTKAIYSAVMFGGTLGGNLTLLGASSNIIAGGICARAGYRISFLRFLKYGVPVTLCQLCVSALYLVALLLLR